MIGLLKLNVAEKFAQSSSISVPHLPLLEKLENLHFKSSILEWVTDYLTRHSHNVVVNDESSQPTRHLCL